MKIAIQPDHILQVTGEVNSYSDRWFALAAERGIDVVEVDCLKPGVIDAIRGCDGFMWRMAFAPPDTMVCRRILWAVSQGLGIPVFPSFEAIWFFEDKVGQAYLLDAIKAPHPQTDVFWRKNEALAAIETMEFPKVIKLAAGIQSRGVGIVHSKAEARAFVEKMFTSGAAHLMPPGSLAAKILGPRTQAMKTLISGEMPYVEQNYALFQEFIPGNDHDTKLTLVGNRVYGYQRDNKPGDFRASGSGLYKYDPDNMDLAAVELTFDIGAALGSPHLAIDFLQRDGKPVVGEITYSSCLDLVRDCPGHWYRDAGGKIAWSEGKLNPADAIFDDFVKQLETEKPLASRLRA